MTTETPVLVARIVTRLNVGGPTRHIRLLQEGVDPDRFRQVLLHGACPPHEGEGVLPVPGERVLIPGLVRPVSPVRDAIVLARLARTLKAMRPALVHTHQGKAGLLGRLAAHRAGVPAVVHTYHGHTFRGYFGPLTGPLVRAAERRAARLSHALICQSGSQEQDVLRHLGQAAEGRTRVIPPPLDPEALSGMDRPAARPEGRRVILLPARLVPIKRPLLAVDVLARLQEHVDAELWILGEGPLEGAVGRRAKQAGVADRVRILAHRAHPGSLYAAADLVLLTSAQEGTPLVVLEALAAGVPVAAPDVGGVADLLEGRGLLLPAGEDAGRWATLLRPLLEAPPDAVTREEQRSRVAERHDPRRLVAAVTALYTELLEQAGIRLPVPGGR